MSNEYQTEKIPVRYSFDIQFRSMLNKELYGMKLLDMLKIDDVVGAIPAHLFAGIWGTLVVAWTNPDASLVTQFIGVVSYGVFTLVVSFVVWTIIKATIGLRATKEDEEYGLDMSELGSVSHPDFVKK